MSKTSKSKTNLLNSPGIIVPRPGLFSSFCFNTVLLLLAWAGAFGCFLTAFDIAVDLTQLTSWSVFFALICAGQYLPERRRWILPLCTVSVWGLALRHHFESVTGGALRVANTMLSAYSERLNVRKVLPLFPAEELLPEEEYRAVTLFTVFLAFLFFWLLSWLFIRRQSLLGSFGLTGLFLLSHLGFSILPNRWAFGALLVFWAFLLFAAPSLRQYHRLAKKSDSFQSSGDMFLHPISLVLLPILALSMLLIYTLFPPETYARPQFIADLRSQLNNSLNLQTVFRGGTEHSNRVEFSSLGSRFYTGTISLQVRHEWKHDAPSYEKSPTGQKDYLKDFVGSVYTGSSWERLPDEDAETVREIWGEQNVQTLPADLMQSMPMGSDPHFSYFVSVRKLGGVSPSVFSPYGLFSPLGPPNNMEYEDDGSLVAPHAFSGVDEYALSAVAIPPLDRLPYYGERFAAYWEDLLEQGIPYDEGTLDDLSQRIAAAMDDPVQMGDRWKVPDWIKELLPAETVSTLIDPLEQYNDFVYSRYTQVPDELRDFLADYAETHGLSPELAQEDRLAYLRQVKRVLAEECAYSWTPPILSDDSDFVTYFLTESRSGYCVHFATAATMLLRSAGIPARYAEGFAVPTGSASNGSGSWINVPDYNAHAWVEVYWGGIGWIPVEMTPAGESVPAAYANAIGPSEHDGLTDLLPVPSFSPSPSPEPVESPSPTPSPAPSDPVSSGPAGIQTSPAPSPSQSPSPSPSPTPSPSPSAFPAVGSQGGTSSGSPPAGPSFFGVELVVSGRLTFYGLALLVLLLLPVPVLLIWVQRTIRLIRRKRLFRQKDRNKAALCVYAHLLRLYWENTLLPGDGVTPPEELEELALKARFSNHILTEAELDALTGRAAALERKLKSNLPKYERLRCKYLRALF